MRFREASPSKGKVKVCRVVKPVAGEVVVIPFPRPGGKRRPALVIADLPWGGDLILCQITSRAHSDAFAVPLDHTE